ncbi:NUDIX hydrolase [Natronomonas halophila]|uniref:NUDIX hydrolase n=1 Tax=Natronomonas halophila TaxID=2747817 RepID=UPI0015B3FF5C|nr:NUDIX hydrolase [Natronomonas halophila]QLD85717.1 NUDIX hydrolase [Natronomonas halophila]
MTDRSPTDHDWTVIESNTEYETGWYTGGYDLVELPDGREKQYYWAALPAAVVIVAVVDDPPSLGLPAPGSPGGGDSPPEDTRSVVMVEQFRPTIRELCYELPAGIVEDGETYAAAGARELEEEVGIVADSVELLEDFWCSTGVLRHRRGIVWAEGFEPGERKLDGSEFLDVRTVPVEDALGVARSDSANDATIEGLLLADADGLL